MSSEKLLLFQNHLNCFILDEQYCQKRQQQRQKKRLPAEVLTALIEPKKLRNSADTEDDAFLMGTCSRAM